jgi:hypothetical protein
MCCLATVLLLLGPRFGIVLWWLADPARWNLAFSSFLWPLLGFLFLPWTTLTFVAVFAGGVTGFEWVWIGLAFLVDVFSYAGGGYTNRSRFTGYGSNG